MHAAVKVLNDSPFRARLLAIDRREQRHAVLITKATYDLREDGTLSLAAEQMPLVASVLETPYGTFHCELFFKKHGADVCVLGSVRRPAPVEHARVQLSVGARRWALSVWGDRRWVRDGGGRLVPSKPEPFVELALGYAQAFGGTHSFEDGRELSFADNPRGRGYYLDEHQAEGRAVANVEDAAEPPVSEWRAEHAVAGWGPYPSFWGLRGRANVMVDEASAEVRKVLPGLFNHAHPQLVLEQLVPGEAVQLEGLHPQPILFRVPRAPAAVDVRIGDRTRALEAPIDGLFLWADARKVVVTQRARFPYALRAEEPRSLTVRPSVSQES